MYFPTAGIEVSPWVPPLVACVVSFFTSMGGVSGAFLLLPFQMSVLGYTAPSVSATNQLFNIVAIPSGLFRYWQEGRLVWPLAWLVIAGTLPGVLLGAIVRINYLPDPRHFKLFAAVVLCYIGGKMLRDLLGGSTTGAGGNRQAAGQTRAAAPKPAGPDQSGGSTICTTCFTIRHFSYTFRGEQYQASTGGVLLLSLIVGVVGGIYGIGGGAIIAPFFVTFFRLPVHTIAGACLMGTFVTSVAGVVFYQALAPLHPELSVAPDWLLGILFGIGGMIGMYFGARCQKYVSARLIKAMLAAVLFFTAVHYIVDFIG